MNKCDRCNERYYRRNLAETWTVRAPGHMKGWRKEISRVCVQCMNVKEARRIIGLFSMNLPRIISRRRKVHA